MKIVLLVITILFCACSCIKYKSDEGFLSSALANVDVYPIQVNGRLCKSNNDTYGGCLLYIPRDVSVKIKLLPLPYNYELSIDCTNALGFEIDEPNIDKETIKEYEITTDHYTGMKESFYCKGEIYPSGTRPASVSFRIFIILTDIRYIDMATPAISGDKMVLGQYAYKSVCCKDTECIFMTKKTVIKNKKYDLCYVESEAGRGAVYVK